MDNLTAVILLCFTVISIAVCKRLNRDEPDYSKLEFGGILHKKDNTITLEDKDVMAVIQFSYSFAKNRFPWTVPDVLNKTKTSDMQRLELVFTYDEENPVYKEDLVGDGRHGDTLHLILFGYLYKFTLKCEVQEKNSFIHQFVVSTFPRDKFNIYSHTYMASIHNSAEKSLQQCGVKNPQSPAVTQSDLLLQREEGSKYLPNDASHWLQDAGQESCDHRESDVNLSGTSPILDFSVMSFNTWNMNSVSGKDKHYVKRMKQFQKVLTGSNPDIIGFQEVRYEFLKGGKLGPNQVQHLADMLEGYQFVFRPGQLQPNSLYEGRTEEGVAIFARYPIISTNHILLFRNRSNTADTHQRVCLHAVIAHPSGIKINILNTHFSLSHEAREKSVIEIWRYIQGLQGPVIFMGDLNAEPDEKAMRFLRGETSLEGERIPGLVDVWLKIHGPRDQGLTYNTLQDTLSKRIDYIFINDSDDIKLLDVSTPDDAYRGHKAASDHLPVLAKFAVTIPET